MADQDGLEGFDEAFARSGRAMAETNAEYAGLGKTMQMTSREAGLFASSLSSNLRRAFADLAVDGAKLSDVMKGVGLSLADTALNIAMKPVTQAMSGVLATGMSAMLGGAAATPFAKGGVFTEGRVMPFARGGIVTQPTNFPMKGGTGLMGEAGPEAIMPLRRGADGRLGVAAASGGGSRPVNVTINVTTPDVGGFSRSQSQIAAQMSRALARGDRNA